MNFQKIIINCQYSKKTNDLLAELSRFAYNKNNLMIELIKITNARSSLPILTLHMLLRNENAVEIYQKKEYYFHPSIKYTYIDGIKFPEFYENGGIEYAKKATFESEFFIVQYKDCTIRKKIKHHPNKSSKQNKVKKNILTKFQQNIRQQLSNF